MVDETFPCTLVLAKAVVGSVITFHDIRSRPRTADFNAEVIVRLSSQGTSSRIALQKTLCQSDACRDVILVHLLDCPVLILVYVRPESLVRPLPKRDETNA